MAFCDGVWRVNLTLFTAMLKIQIKVWFRAGYFEMDKKHKQHKIAHLS